MVKKQGGRKSKISADRLRIYNEYIHMDDPEVKLTPGDDIELQDNAVEEGEH